MKISAFPSPPLNGVAFLLLSPSVIKFHLCILLIQIKRFFVLYPPNSKSVQLSVLLLLLLGRIVEEDRMGPLGQQKQSSTLTGYNR